MDLELTAGKRYFFVVLDGYGDGIYQGGFIDISYVDSNSEKTTLLSVYFDFDVEFESKFSRIFTMPEI